MRENVDFSHIDKNGEIQMVDVSEKFDTFRIARAHAKVKMKKETLEALIDGKNPKGNVFTTAKLAGILAAKRTYELIPLCHNIFLSKVDLSFEIDRENGTIRIFSLAKSTGKTGVEMEALTAVSIAALTIYDMCKALEKGIEITDIYLLEKDGGKSGHWINDKHQGGQSDESIHSDDE